MPGCGGVLAGGAPGNGDVLGAGGAAGVTALLAGLMTSGVSFQLAVVPCFGGADGGGTNCLGGGAIPAGVNVEPGY